MTPDEALATYGSLVRALARWLHGRLHRLADFDDLFQAGMLGLLILARRYERDGKELSPGLVKKRVRGAMIDSVRQFTGWRRCARVTLCSIFASSEEGEETNLAEEIPSAEEQPLATLLRHEQEAAMREALIVLTPRQRTILRFYYWQELTDRHIGAELSRPPVSESGVCRIRIAARKRLLNLPRLQALRP
jgi:RNA polymerase sigma factor (sigma-70 family)